MRFTIHDAASIAYGPDFGRTVRHEEQKESYAMRRNEVYNAAYKYAHIEADEEFFTEAMEGARDLMKSMMSAYQAFDYAELGILVGVALERQRKILAERETVRIMNE